MKRNKSLEKALKKIDSIFRKQDQNQITIQRKYLPEIFSADLLGISEDDGLPILQPFVLEYFTTNGIKVKFSINEAEFEARYGAKKQLETTVNLFKLKDEQIRTLENSLSLKDEQIKKLERTILLQEEKIRKLASSDFWQENLRKKEEKITQLQKEIEILNENLSKANFNQEKEK